MTQNLRVLMHVGWWMMAVVVCNGFQLPKRFVSTMGTRFLPHGLHTTANVDMDEMRRDIETMKQEAWERLDALNHQMEDYEAAIRDKRSNKGGDESEQPVRELPVVSTSNLPDPDLSLLKADASAPSKGSQSTLSVESSTPSKDSISTLKAVEQDFSLDALERRIESDHLRMEYLKNPEKSLTTSSISSSSSDTNLLDGTRWRLMFNLGREQGTWMPKTWGVSGERLHMNLEIEFTPTLLQFERDEFLNGVTVAKVLHVVNNELTVGPSMREGSKRVRVRDGAYAVVRGQGPLGTDVLRFYLELEEETRHIGSDVYCPAGRLYCTQGYFPMESRSSTTYREVGMKEKIRNEQKEINLNYSRLIQEHRDDKNLISWKKVQRTKKIMDLQLAATKLKDRMRDAKIKEPERRSLRLSRDSRVGLTREGGVCCKVPKGLAIEYQILGKFEVASIDNREHADYRELLP